MDNLQDLDEAITSSIAEQSLNKINDYFERSSFGAKHLNDKSISILLRSLEQDGSSEEKVVNVKCVLNCMHKFLELKPNSTSWEQLSENISKICELCFCISVKLNDKELIALNISVLEKMMQVSKNLTNHIFGYLLDPCLTALSMYYGSFDFDLSLNLSNFTSSLCENTSRMKRNEIVPTVTHHLNTLSNLLTSCGDYEIQAAIIEVLARCKSSIIPSMTNDSNQKLNLFSCSTKLGEEFNKYSFVNFDPECRLFLNALNESLGDKRKVYSVPCICIVHNSVTLKKPKDPGYKSFWVDFNIARKRISFYHERTKSNWDFERVPFEEVVNVIAKDSICGAKYGNKTIESVKVEFSLCKNNILHESIELLKIYCRKIQFDLLHRVLKIVFRDIYECEVGIDQSLNVPDKFSYPTQFMELSKPEESNKAPPPRSASNYDETGLALLEHNVQHNTMHIKSSTEKQNNNRRETFTQNKANISEEINLNHGSPLNAQVDITKNTCSFVENNYKRKGRYPSEDINMKYKNRSIEVNNDIKKSSKVLKKPCSVDMNLSKNQINYSPKHPTGHNGLNTKESTVKRKRLYSIENEDISVKSIILSSQEEQQPLSKNASLNKRIAVEGETREKSCFLNKKIKRSKVASKNNNHFRLFSDGSSSDDSKPCLDSKTSNQAAMSILSNKDQRDSVFSDKHYSKRVDNKLLALNRTPESTKLSNLFSQSISPEFSSGIKATSMKSHKTYMYPRPNKRKVMTFTVPSDSDSDYKPNCAIKETKGNVPNKRVLRNRKKPLSKVDLIDGSKSNNTETISNDETSPCLMETNQDSTIPRNLKKLCLGIKQSSNKNSATIFDIEHLCTSNTNENKCTLKNRLHGSQGFLNAVASSRIVEPTRDETLCNDIQINAVQPEDSEILTRKIKTFEAKCEIEGQVFIPPDLDLVDSKDFAACGASASKTKLKSNRRATGNPLNTWSMKVDDMSVEIHNDSFCQDMNLIESTFKVDDILEFSHRSVLNLKTNIKTSLVQSQEKREQHLFDYDLQLQASRNSILANCERLDVNCCKLNKLKASLDVTLDLQKDLVTKIQSEMANLEEAKIQLFKKESEAKKNETFSIMNIFKGIGTYVRRLLFTSFRENALS